MYDQANIDEILKKLYIGDCEAKNISLIVNEKNIRKPINERGEKRKL